MERKNGKKYVYESYQEDFLGKQKADSENVTPSQAVTGLRDRTEIGFAETGSKLNNNNHNDSPKTGAGNSTSEGSSCPQDKDINHRALIQALDIRKFEIELYWKRATYFWTFTAAIFAGYFLVLTKSHPSNKLLCLMGCLGFAFTLCWYLVNKGSKFWQNNWERHVDLLEDEKIGPLYKTIVFGRGLKVGRAAKFISVFFLPAIEYPFSVSKVNQMLSFYVCLVWVGLMLYPAISQYKWVAYHKDSKFIPWFLIGFTVICMIGVIASGDSQWSKSLKQKKNSDMPESDVDEDVKFFQRRWGEH